MPASPCPVCRASDPRPFFSQKNVPCHIGTLWPDAASAEGCPRGDVDLAACRTCGFIWNRSFDPARMEYTVDYDNTLHFSPHYQKYAERVAADLVERHGLRGKVVVELGSGKGEFLHLLCGLGGNRGYGFDPSYDGRYADSEGDVTFVREFYTADTDIPAPDLVVSRYVFEHVPNPTGFLDTVRSSLKGRPAVVYFEVPNALLFLRDGSPWDVIYEHCSYFAPASLRAVFERCGFTVTRVEEQYDGQMIGIEAVPSESTSDPATGSEAEEAERIVGLAEHFGREYERRVAAWHSWEASLAADGRRAAVWGAGAKAVSFLNLLSDSPPISAVVDVNPAKHGKFVPGTRHRIVAPEDLRKDRPETVVIMNPVYEREILETLDGLGLNPEVRRAF